MMKRDRCGMWVLRLLRQRSPKRNGLQTGAARDWKSGEGSTVAGVAARGRMGGPEQCGSAKEKRAAKENNKSKPEAVHVRLLGLRVRWALAEEHIRAARTSPLSASLDLWDHSVSRRAAHRAHRVHPHLIMAPPSAPPNCTRPPGLYCLPRLLYCASARPVPPRVWLLCPSLCSLQSPCQQLSIQSRPGSCANAARLSGTFQLTDAHHDLVGYRTATHQPTAARSRLSPLAV
jgi:hypothetical protein